VEKLYDTKTAGEMIGKKAVTVRWMAAKHNIGQRVGRDWVFTDADIERMKALPGPGRPVRKPGSPTRRPRKKASS
jgi:hypothetical protein